MDNSIYEAMAVQLLRFHQLQYVGSWDQNFPGIVYLHALAITLFRNSEPGFRVFDLLCQTAGCVLLFAIVRRWFSDRTAYLAAFFMAVLYINGRDWNAGQRDGFAAVFVIAATLLFYTLKDRSQKGESQKFSRLQIPIFLRAMLVGVLVGIAISIRPTFGLFAIVLAIAFLMLPGSTGISLTPDESKSERLTRLSFQWSSLKLVLWFGFGILLVFALILLPYSTIPGGLREVYLATIRYNLDVYASPRYRIPFGRGMREHLQIFADVVLVGAILLFAFRAWQKKQRRSNSVTGKESGNSATVSTDLFVHAPDPVDIFIFIGYYCSSELSVLVMGKYFRYHYAMLSVVTAILAAIILESLLLRVRSATLRTVFLLSFVLVTVGWTVQWPVVGFFVNGLQHSSHPLEYTHQMFDSVYDPPGEKQRELASTVRSRTHRGDRIEFCGEDANLYWQTELEPASRFTMIYPLTVKPPSGKYTEYQLEWRKEFVDSIRSVKPRLIILANKPDSDQTFLFHPPSVLMRAIPGFDSLLKADYSLDTEFYTWSIFRRDSVSGGIH